MSEFLKVIQNVKALDPELGTTESVKILDSLSKAMNIAFGSFTKQISTVIGTMKPNFKKEVIELITKFNTGDNEERMIAFEKIKKLQEKFNFDLNNFTKVFGIKIDKFNEIIDELKNIEENRKKVAEEELRLFESRDLIFKTDEKGNIIPLTKKQQLMEIYDIQKQVGELEKQRITIQKQFEKNNITADEFKEKIKELDKNEKILNERKRGVKYDDPDRPKTLRERAVGAVQSTGAFLRGERGPALVQGVLGGMYGAVSSPIEAGRQIYESLDMFTFGLTSKLTKGLGNLLLPAFKGFTSILSKGFLNLGGIFTSGFTKFGTLILRGLLLLASVLGISNLFSGIKNLFTTAATALGIGAAVKGGTAAATAGAASTAAGTAGGIGTLGTIGMLAAPFAGVGALAFLNRPRNEEEAEFMKQNSEITSKETTDPSLYEGYNEGRMQAREAGERRIARGDTFESLEKSLSAMKIGGTLEPAKSNLRTMREELPKNTNFAELNKEFMASEREGRSYSPITNNVVPTNINSNTVQNINQNVEVINREPTINLINSQGYGYTVV